MSNEYNSFNPKLKFYHVLLLGTILSTLLLFNSSHINNLRAQEKVNNSKNNLFNKIIYQRKLDGDDTSTPAEKSSDKVCKLGSKELINYYKTSNLQEIYLKEGSIECEDKNEDYMDALIDIIKSFLGDKNEDDRRRYLNEGAESNEDGEEKGLTDNLLTYGKHIIEVGIFLVLGVLCIPGWMMCIF